MKNAYIIILLMQSGLYFPVSHGAEEYKSIGIVNLTGETGRSFTANKENSYDISSGKPGVASFKVPTGNLSEYFQKNVLKILMKSGQYQINDISKAVLSEKDARYIVDGTSSKNLKRGVLEKIAKLGRENKVDLVFYISPVDDYYQFMDDGTFIWYVYTKNAGLLYRWDGISGYLTFVAHFIDAKTRRVLTSSRFSVYKRLSVQRRRGLNESVIAEIVSSINSLVILQHNKISADIFPDDRSQTPDEIEEIVSRLNEEEDEDLMNHLTKLMEPGHHTIEEYNELPEDVKLEIWTEITTGNDQVFDSLVTRLLNGLVPPEPDPEYD